MEKEILKMNGITQIYGNGVIANKDVSLTVNRGEIHALVGENGAGKSTLMKILFGFEKKDSGEILFDGQNLDGKKPAEIIECGIGMVHQHFMLVESLRVYENVILGMEPKKGLSTDKEAAIQMVKELSEKYNLSVDPMAKVSDISVGLKQKVENLSFENKDKKKVLKNVNFEVKRGQILGIAGVEGNGQNELAECIFGFHKGVDGKVLFEGKNLLEESIRQIRENGVSYIPEDRLSTGVATKVSIWENLVSDRIDSQLLRVKRLLSQKKIQELSQQLIKEYTILCRNENQEVGMLSGGNMQKVVVAREFSANPDLLIANQPTRGIDVGANEFIWKRIIELRDQGKAIMLVSADLNEVLELSDSIMVMCDGEVAGYFEDSKAVSEYELGLYMLGLKKQGQEVAAE